MAFFGEAMAKAMDGDGQPKPGPRNLLALLPDRFTLADAEYARTANGHNAEGTRNMLNQWAHRGYIISTEGGYEKIKNYINFSITSFNYWFNIKMVFFTRK